MGSLASGALDGQLVSLAVPETGRLFRLEFSDTDALIAGLPAGGRATVAVVPAASMPEAIWALLLERQTIALVADLDGDDIVSIRLANSDDDHVAELVESGSTVNELTPAHLITVLVPVPRLAVFGGGPNAQSLDDTARLLGWHVSRSTDPDTAMGLMAGLSPLDAAIVMGHDVEASSRVLGAALESRAGYIGALGSMKMQQNRADWLAYRGVTDISRVHGPAGFDIGARSPAEIALSVLAEAVGELNRSESAD